MSDFYIIKVGEGVTCPAIPIDCGICNEDFNASQYTGVILSKPNRVPTRIRVGLKAWPSGFAILMNVSS